MQRWEYNLWSTKHSNLSQEKSKPILSNLLSPSLLLLPPPLHPPKLNQVILFPSFFYLYLILVYVDTQGGGEEEKEVAPTPTITTALKGTRIKFDEMSLVNVGVSSFYFPLLLFYLSASFTRIIDTRMCAVKYHSYL